MRIDRASRRRPQWGATRGNCPLPRRRGASPGPSPAALILAALADDEGLPLGTVGNLDRMLEDRFGSIGLVVHGPGPVFRFAAGRATFPPLRVPRPPRFSRFRPSVGELLIQPGLGVRPVAIGRADRDLASPRLVRSSARRNSGAGPVRRSPVPPRRADSGPRPRPGSSRKPHRRLGRAVRATVSAARRRAGPGPCAGRSPRGSGAWPRQRHRRSGRGRSNPAERLSRRAAGKPDAPAVAWSVCPGLS